MRGEDVAEHLSFQTSSGSIAIVRDFEQVPAKAKLDAEGYGNSSRSFQSPLKVSLRIRDAKNTTEQPLTIFRPRLYHVELAVQRIVDIEASSVEKISIDDSQTWYHTLDCVAA